MQEKTQNFGGFLCFCLIAGLELMLFKIMLKAGKVKKHPTKREGVWKEIKKRHPYNFSSDQKKLGFLGVGLAMMMCLWNSAGWRVAISVTICVQAVFLVIWDIIEAYFDHRLNLRNMKQKNRADEIGVDGEIIKQNKPKQTKNDERDHIGLLNTFYLIILLITLPLILGQTISAISVGLQVMLPMTIYFVLMVPISRFALAVVIPQIVVSVWVMTKSYSLTQKDSQTEEINEKDVEEPTFQIRQKSQNQLVSKDELLGAKNGQRFTQKIEQVEMITIKEESSEENQTPNFGKQSMVSHKGQKGQKMRRQIYQIDKENHSNYSNR